MGEELLAAQKDFPLSEDISSNTREFPKAELCQEGLQCGQDTSAEYFCTDCGSYQCSQCEAFLHCTNELKQHNRKKIQRGAVSVCKLWCNPKNTVTVYCKQCEMDMCVECDLKMHQGGRKEHIKVASTPSSALNADDTKTKDSSDEIVRAFLLVNNNEELLVTDEEVFVKQLGCSPSDKVKVLSIFGNTGDGKSYTLNHTFFHGQEIFHTSARQTSCTIGVWASYSPEYKTIFIDSEGLLGASKNENQRTRLLLKVLAVSDVVIYRTRAERLHNDLFTFLGDASDAYWKYFTPELKSASERCQLNVPLSTLGPSVVIFHETQHTEILGEGATCTTDVMEPSGTKPVSEVTIINEPQAVKIAATLDECIESEIGGPGVSPDELNLDSELQIQPMTAEELLRIRFSEQGRIPKAFCSIEYVGTRTQRPPTDFSGLETSIRNLLKNNAVRAPRTPAVVLRALQILNDKFSGDITSVKVSTFPDAYFTCPQECLACGVRCSHSMNHIKDGMPHKIADNRCKYSHTFDNKIYLCKVCFNRGVESVVVPKTSTSKESGWFGLAKYAWAGFVIECKQCGVIYRSRQHWYGNKDPELKAVKTENKHIWPEDLPTAGQGSDNTARRFLESVGNVAGAVGSVSSRPTKMVTSWMADKVAPSYWVSNSKITVCGDCKKEFTTPSETKHHCRACGGGFCDKCSSKTMPVPWRGWGNVPVRVCNSCYTSHHGTNTSDKKSGKSSSPTSSSDSKPKAKPIDSKTDSTTSRIKDMKKTDSLEVNVTARYVGEVMQSAVGIVSGAISYPKGMIVESARPVYWVPDDKITSCYNCKNEFGTNDSKHHCRACGRGFCDKCSTHQLPVPSRGWDYPVRVCDSCASRTDL